MKQKSSYFRKLVVSLILTALLPIFIGIILFYNYSAHNLSAKISAGNQAVLDQTADSLTVALESVLEVSKLLLLDTSFKTYSLLDDKEFFDSYRGSPGELSDNLRFNYSRYLELRSNISSKLDLIPILNEFIKSVYFYDESTAILFKSGAIPERIYEKSKVEWFRARLYPIKNINESKILLTDPYDKDEEIVIVYRNILKNLTFFVSIDTKLLFKTIHRESSLYADSLRFVLSREHVPILYESKTELEVYSFIKVIREVLDFSNDSSVFKLNGNRYFGNKTKIPIVGWSLYSFVDAHTYATDFMMLRIMIVSIATTLLILIFLSAYIYLKLFYSPFEGLIRSIQSDLKITRNSEDSDFTYIKNYIDLVTAENNYLESRLTEALPSLKKDFLQDLLKTNEYSLDEINERFELLDINLTLENIQVLIILIDDNSFINLDFKQQILFRISIKEILEEKLRCAKTGELLEMESHKYIYLINVEKQIESSIQEMANTAIDSIRETLNCESNITIGSIGRSIYDLATSYKEADELLKYLMIFGKGSSITREDIEFERDHFNDGEKTLNKKVSAIIKHINKIEIRKSIHEIESFLEILFNPEHSYSDQIIQQKKIELLNKVLIAAGNLNLKNDEILINSQNLYLELHSKITAADISEFYHCLLYQISENTEIEAVSETNEYINAIYSILEKDYGESMNLNQLSERVKLNPSYISRLFKESTGISFTNYLTNLRINKAKNFLIETDKPVQEICKDVGYWNTNYFIKVFKKSEGSTPGEYRKQIILEKNKY
ncbi:MULTISPECIES: AraC family transcriptional regulator [unclassified Oceanispirochaeta]|uniref:helix-turn-helix domain-containing protein n=1 Tax=unclassified Oceanispirochaeta TaxID=2635722 RepID=UPI000E08EA4A|nr:MULTISPECIES: AraC family transcriptional regulator [unclassified Oceanispirochaeta]MBF9014271.1 AraC family transcriptional regulator [Oceanispirochaeta sp. M2]NPD71157.1 helix-turn-helix transcriptional regulator [Oceanispirochaeta sp. M1]RDG33549.1 AraC family transcriptional regulator [Oceanispirochaeta sp. M1]